MRDTTRDFVFAEDMHLLDSILGIQIKSRREKLYLFDGWGVTCLKGFVVRPFPGDGFLAIGAGSVFEYVGVHPKSVTLDQGFPTSRTHGIFGIAHMAGPVAGINELKTRPQSNLSSP